MMAKVTAAHRIVLFQLSMLPARTLELICKSGHVSSQFVDLVLRVAEGILMREAFVQLADTRLNATVNTFAQFFPGGSGQGGVALKVCKAEMEKHGVSDSDFNLMRMAAVGHYVDVSGVDQASLAWFLDCDFAEGLRGKSLGVQLGGQGGAAFKAAQAEMATYKVSDHDFVRMRMEAVGHDVDVSGVDQTALAWFLNCDSAKGLRGKSLAANLGRNAKYMREHQNGCGGSTSNTLERVLRLTQHTPHFFFHSPTSVPMIQMAISTGSYSRCSRAQIGTPTGLTSSMEWTKSVRKLTLRHFANMVPT
jgi:hypothetical protein